MHNNHCHRVTALLQLNLYLLLLKSHQYRFLPNSFQFVIPNSSPPHNHSWLYILSFWRRSKPCHTIISEKETICFRRIKIFYYCVLEIGVFSSVDKKVKQFHYRPGQALSFSGVWGSQISRQSAHKDGKVVSPTHRPPLPLRKYSWYSFLLEAESTSRP
jgi:hypothetical protein